MIEPGEKFKIEYEGETYLAACLTRRQQRQAVSLLGELSNIDESTESLQKVYDIADTLLELCVPGLTESQKDRMNNTDIFAIVGKAVAAQMMGGETKKKSASRHSLGQVNSAETVTPDVFVTMT